MDKTLILLIIGIILSAGCVQQTGKISNNKKFLDDPLLCEKDSDCVFQQTEATCRSCDCLKPINIYNFKEINCPPSNSACNVYCKISEVKCINNKCTGIEK